MPTHPVPVHSALMEDHDRTPAAAPDPSLAELIEGSAKRLATSLLIAGAAIAVAIYARPGPPRYQAFAAPDGSIVRIDMRSGTVLSCQGRNCYRVVRRGQRLEDGAEPKALPAPAASGPAAVPPPTEAPVPPAE